MERLQILVTIVSDGGCLALTLLTGEETLREQVLSVRKANPQIRSECFAVCCNSILNGKVPGKV